MKLLIDAILDKGKILEGNILKVDTIINHQIDPVLMDEIGDEFYNHFKAHIIAGAIPLDSTVITFVIPLFLKWL